MSSDRRAFTSAEQEYAWNKAKTITGMNPDTWREDNAGNLIKKSAYGDISQQTGWDVDHSKPLAAGGTYHPNNIQALQSYQNRVDKRDTYPYDMSRAEPAGVAAPRPLDSSTVDGRSGAIRSGDLLLNRDGTVNMKSAAVRSGDVLVTKSGQVDGRSAAVKSGSVKLK